MESQQTIEHIVGLLQVIPGVTAIVLGGSRARGTHTPESDIDIGIYYKPDAPIDISAAQKVAETLDDLRRSGLITPIGEWGPWINGGGWLKVDGIPVDFLYRDLTKVAETIEDCIQERVTVDYQPGHPHGFTNSIYMGEIAACVPLWDPEGIVAALKTKTRKYPAKLKQATIFKFLWEADFSSEGAEKGVSRRDVSYAAGHLFRAISCLTQALFALNETYLLKRFVRRKNRLIEGDSNGKSFGRRNARIGAARIRAGSRPSVSPLWHGSPMRTAAMISPKVFQRLSAAGL